MMLEKKTSQTHWHVFFLSHFFVFCYLLLPFPKIPALCLPNLLLISMMFWLLTKPQRHGLLYCLLIGLLADTCYGTYLGQYAISYCICGYFILRAYARIRMFPIWQQAMVLALISALFLFIFLCIGQWCGNGRYSPWIWISIFSNACTWFLVRPFLLFLLGRPDTKIA